MFVEWVLSQPVPAPTHRGTWWFRQEVKEEEVGEKLCLVVQHRQPSPRGCSQARRVLIVFYLFMIYFVISHNRVTFHGFLAFRESRGLGPVTISVTFDAATCSCHCCWGPGSSQGHSILPPPPNSQQWRGLAALQCEPGPSHSCHCCPLPPPAQGVQCWEKWQWQRLLPQVTKTLGTQT